MSSAVSPAAEDLFNECGHLVERQVRASEELALWFETEDSSFVRFNHGKVRQAGDVNQRMARLELRVGRRRAAELLPISGGKEEDAARMSSCLERLREVLPMLPEDPYLHRPEAPQSTAIRSAAETLDAEWAAEQILREAHGVDLVGILASGTKAAGYVDTRGQRNWYDSRSFHFDFSLYHQADKAVKGCYAGTHFDVASLQHQLEDARLQLDLLRREPVTISPGQYRAYLAPHALFEIMSLLADGAFGARDLSTKQSPLTRLLHGASLSPLFHVQENSQGGFGPAFNRDGFVRPPAVSLLRGGALDQMLVSARSAGEFGLPCNGASDAESPESMEVAPGSLRRAEALSSLEEGVWVSNLWYLNYSDRPAGRITGMTRFACFWVEGGRIKAPLNVMRFDDTVYRFLGSELIDLSAERECIFDAHSYGARSTRTALLPGALVNNLTFTL